MWNLQVVIKCGILQIKEFFLSQYILQTSTWLTVFSINLFLVNPHLQKPNYVDAAVTSTDSSLCSHFFRHICHQAFVYLPILTSLQSSQQNKPVLHPFELCTSIIICLEGHNIIKLQIAHYLQELDVYRTLFVVCKLNGTQFTMCRDGVRDLACNAGT